MQPVVDVAVMASATTGAQSAFVRMVGVLHDPGGGGLLPNHGDRRVARACHGADDGADDGVAGRLSRRSPGRAGG